MATSSIICLSFFLLFSCATCFNITKLLDTYDDFKTFNNYLTQTKLADEINKRQTITVLAVANDQMGGVSGSDDILKRIMSLHVVLDYYDGAKLSKLSKHTALLTTLFQSSGNAMNRLGFLNVTHMKNGEIAFGSAAKDSPLNAKLVKKVAAQPYNISVLQISSAIVPDGIQNLNQTAKPTPPPTPSPKKAPSAGPKKAPSPKKSKASPPTSEAPAPDVEAPTSDPPSDALSPSDVPASSPPSPVADGPGSVDADAPTQEDTSSSTHVTMGTFVGIVMVAISSWVSL